jgi:hypothetical protein
MLWHEMLEVGIKRFLHDIKQMGVLHVHLVFTWRLRCVLLGGYSSVCMMVLRQMGREAREK